ncbi:hypothetical protein TraAM80_06212 [Trypanosoma rangeli]|uniref:Uncharacterized protein n=1 Tax=Trypanosoma rangeli TaxID=5698 RepID=A0A422NB34_TRYRA|nr:uncharacterized protein TraAM80_06212 [Trypanosoma rangeli]RNF02690.1 hypothetical protein TraAM80_06212 [Trypanosoma rangeli]|eukprot:RNF02690.1 hypothetical protein TraAM80_06212 [Trypanosoma rangeli]
MKKWWTDASREEQSFALSHANDGRGGSESSAAPAAAEDFFGGMKVVRTRHKRSAASTAGSHTPRGNSSVSVQLKKYASPVASAAESSPFFMRFEMPSSTVQDEVETPQVTQMRHRLERFFEVYDPSKLSQVENTIKAFVGREEELFMQLVSNYGPEPTELKASALPTGEKVLPPGSASETESAFDFISSGLKKQRCDKREGVAAKTQSSVVGSSYMHSKDAADLNSRQMSRNGDCTLQEVVDDVKPAFDFIVSRKAGTASSAYFVPSAAVAALNLVPESIAEGNDEAVVRDAEGMKAEAEATPHVCRNFLELNKDNNNMEDGTVVEENDKSSRSRDSKGSRGSNSSRNKVASSDAESEPETIWDRQRREVQDLQGDVLLARTKLSLVLDEIRSSIERRRDCMATVSKIENRIEQCVAQEAFEEAALLSDELEQLSSRVAELDGAPVRLLTSLNQQCDATVKVVQSLAQLLQRHRQELMDSKDDADRRVKKFIKDVKESLETRKEQLGAAFERARRLEESARREQSSLRERKTTLREKMLRQSEELQTLQGRISQEKMEVDAEIAVLEAKLATLRQKSAEKMAELEDVTSTLARMGAEQESMERDIDNFFNEEEKRIRGVTADMEQLQKESDVLRVEEEAFDTKRESMLSELENDVMRIEGYEQRRRLLETVTLLDLQKYTNAVVELLQLRNAGRGVLFAAPSLTLSGAEAGEPQEEEEEEEGEEEEEEWPLLHVSRLQKQLSTLNADDVTCEALVASLGAQLAEMRNNIPLLEAVKKSAATALRFKEAQLKADEIRRLTASIAEYTAAIDAAQERMRANALKRSSLQKKITEERAKAAVRMRGFLASYRDALEAAAMATSANATPNVLQLAPNDQGHDDLAEAMQRLMTTLRQECSEMSFAEQEENAAGGDDSLEEILNGTTTSGGNVNLDEQEV